MKGNVKFFNEGKGFGFIAGEDGSEYFVHMTDLEGCTGRDLQENTPVTFEVAQGDRGPKAAHVKLSQGGEEAPDEDLEDDDSEEDLEDDDSEDDSEEND